MIMVSAVTTPAPASAPPQLDSAAAGSGVVSTAFSYTLAATNTPSVFGASSLPPGLNLNTGTGAITGTPTTAGTFAVPVSAANAFGTSTATLTITVYATASAQTAAIGVLSPLITSPASAGGYTGQSLSYTLAATYAGSPYIYSPSQGYWTFSATGLPPGLALTSASGYYGSTAISGTPTTAGTYQAAVSATSPASTSYPPQATATVKAIVTFIIEAGPNAVPTFTGSANITGVVGNSVSYPTYATNSPTSYAASNLPPGLSINATSGTISGAPTAGGTYQAALTATNGVGTGSATVTFRITGAAAPNIISPAAAYGTVGSTFGYNLTASTTATVFGASNMPPGLSLNTSTGYLSGTPTTAGVYVMPVTVTNAAGTGGATVTITIAAAAAAAVPVIVSNVVAQGTVGTDFYYSVNASGSPTSYAASGLPTGLSFDVYGDISGIPTTPGSYPVTVSATNAAGTGTVTLTLVIAPLPLPVPDASAVANGTVGTYFDYYFDDEDGAPTTYATSGLPTGLTLNATAGTIAGTPTTAGTYTVPIAVTNASGTSHFTLTVVIAPSVTPGPPVITSAAGTMGYVGSAFSYATQASGSPTVYAISSVPPGLSFSTTTGVLSGTPTTAGTYTPTLSANNASGTGSAVLNFVVSGAITQPSGVPIITSQSEPALYYNEPFYYAITATNSPRVSQRPACHPSCPSTRPRVSSQARRTRRTGNIR